MIEMVMADQQVIDLFENIRIGRKFTLTTDERNIAKDRVEHDPFTTQLHKERIMS